MQHKSYGWVCGGCAVRSRRIQERVEAAGRGGRAMEWPSACAGKILRPFVLRRGAGEVERGKVNDLYNAALPYQFLAVPDTSCAPARKRDSGAATKRAHARRNQNGSDQARGKRNVSADRPRSRGSPRAFRFHKNHTPTPIAASIQPHLHPLPTHTQL